MIELLTYLFYVLAVLTIPITYLVFHFKLEKIRTKIKFLLDIMDKGYETDQIDLNNYLK